MPMILKLKQGNSLNYLTFPNLILKIFTMSRFQRSSDLFLNAQKHIPGGVNSPVRAFKGVLATQFFFVKAKALI